MRSREKLPGTVTGRQLGLEFEWPRHEHQCIAASATLILPNLALVIAPHFHESTANQCDYWRANWKVEGSWPTERNAALQCKKLLHRHDTHVRRLCMQCAEADKSSSFFRWRFFFLFFFSG
jgi:hypothetical protein